MYQNCLMNIQVYLLALFQPLVKKVAKKNFIFPLETCLISRNKLTENAPGVSLLNFSGYSTLNETEVMKKYE